jgi:hypothetical protein
MLHYITLSEEDVRDWNQYRKNQPLLPHHPVISVLQRNFRNDVKYTFFHNGQYRAPYGLFAVKDGKIVAEIGLSKRLQRQHMGQKIEAGKYRISIVEVRDES